MIKEALTCLFGGFFAVIEGFNNAMPLYFGLSDLNEHIVAYILGIPASLISIYFLVKGAAKIIKLLTK